MNSPEIKLSINQLTIGDLFENLHESKKLIGLQNKKPQQQISGTLQIPDAVIHVAKKNGWLKIIELVQNGPGIGKIGLPLANTNKNLGYSYFKVFLNNNDEELCFFVRKINGSEKVIKRHKFNDESQIKDFICNLIKKGTAENKNPANIFWKLGIKGVLRKQLIKKSTKSYAVLCCTEIKISTIKDEKLKKELFEQIKTIEENHQS